MELFEEPELQHQQDSSSQTEDLRTNDPPGESLKSEVLSQKIFTCSVLAKLLRMCEKVIGNSLDANFFEGIACQSCVNVVLAKNDKCLFCQQIFQPPKTTYNFKF